MTKRIIAALVFFAGAYLVWAVLSSLSGLGKSLGGMSASSQSSSSISGAATTWLYVGYFVASGIAIVVCRRRNGFKSAAISAHSILAIAILIDGLQGGPVGVLLWAALVAVCLSPWFFVWHLMYVSTAA
jgi:hypothetical protein